MPSTMSQKGDTSPEATPMEDKAFSRPASPGSTGTPPSLSEPTAPSTATASGELRITKARSSTGLSSELLYKSKTQISRVEALNKLKGQLPTCAQSTTLEEVLLFIDQVQELHKAFDKEHTYLKVMWPATCQDHEYFQDNYFAKENNLVSDLRRRLGVLREELCSPQSHHNPSSSLATKVKLPKLKLPSFSGDYLEWPAFREFFLLFIGNNARLSNIEKLCYLRSSLKGQAARLVKCHPFTGDSYTRSWESLESWYNNKRMLIRSCFNKLLSLAPLTQESAAALHHIATTLTNANLFLLAQGNHEELWNSLVVQLISWNLDKTTREDWETSLSLSSECPRITQLAEFLRSRACVLERIESSVTRAAQSAPAAVNSPKAGQRNTDRSRKTAQHMYPCDCCNGKHFIVSCSKFRELSVPERCKLVDRRSLCRNCCGRHGTASCRSPNRCKQCNAMHHTMMHFESATK